MQEVKYPQIKITLVGENGNAYAILGRCIKAMKRAKLSNTEIETFKKEATSHDYPHLLTTVMNYFTCD